MPMQNVIERAFELARGGTSRSVDDIRRKLKAEGFESVESHLGGNTVKRQLVQAMTLTA